MRFTKPATSIDGQIALLRRRGMVIDDDQRARHYLNYISYYRLRAYWLPFEVPAEDGDHAFTPGTSFEDVLALYVFDRQLRLLVLDAIERVEVAIRGQWAHHMAMKHGPHGYLEERLYDDRRDFHARAVASLSDEFTLSRDTFAVHYWEKYSNPALPPIWMTAEIISFGQLSKWIYNLKRRTDRKAIAKPFGLDERVLCSVAHHISHVRNVCAHHGRLWNKRFTVKMAVPKYPAKLPATMQGADRRKLHNTLVILDYLLSVIAPGSAWRGRLVALIDTCPLASPESMGFPQNWRTRAAWRVEG